MSAQSRATQARPDNDLLSPQLPTIRLTADPGDDFDALPLTGSLVLAGAQAARDTAAGSPWRFALSSSDGADLGARVDASELEQIATGIYLAGIVPARRRVGGFARPWSGPDEIDLALGEPVTAEHETALQRAHIVATAVAIARNHANAPSNLKNPEWFSDQAQQVARRRGLECEIWDENELERRGCGGLLAVGRGSAHPPRLAILRYRPESSVATAAARRRLVLVGKGITFDTGGISIKPAEAMALMRTDCSGAAAAMAVIDAVAQLRLEVELTVLLPLAENAVGGASFRPGDVIYPFGGARAVHIGNTDAEGRLVLADALAYASLELKPDLLIDIATLTGAARVALARSAGASFTADAELADALARVGARTGENWWRLPLVEDYREAISAPPASGADIDNAGAHAGAITAALFLREFVGEAPWMHLDVAGPSRRDLETDPASPIYAAGATGFGVRSLIELLDDLVAPVSSAT